MFVSKAALNAQILARVIMQNITKINWLDVGAKVVRKIASGLLSLAGKMGSTAKSLGMRAVTAFRGISWGSVGSNIVKGIIGGIGGRVSGKQNAGTCK